MSKNPQIATSWWAKKQDVQQRPGNHVSLFNGGLVDATRPELSMRHSLASTEVIA